MIYWAGEDGANPHHAAIVTKVENGEIYYSAHTNEKVDEAISNRLGGELVYIIRIRDEAVRGYIN